MTRAYCRGELVTEERLQEERELQIERMRADAAAMGLVLQDDDIALDEEVPTLWLWSEHEEPLRVFQVLDTQWTYAMGGGRIGLSYSSIESVLRLMGIPAECWAERFAELRVMEDEALRADREQQA